VAQPGSAPVLGTGGRRFKSGHPDFRASSSGGQSNGLLSRGSGVRVPSGALTSRVAEGVLQPKKKWSRRIAFCNCSYNSNLVVSVAQLAEHRVVASVVEGSNPFTHPILPAMCSGFLRWAVSSVGRAADS
jgi:hypothetical protein